MSPAAPSAPSERIGVFGKLPAHGDFVSRGLGEGARAAWDRLLSEGLARAVEALGPALDIAHDSAPPWRFVLPPGAGLGEGWCAGAMAASVDRVGRRFFIVTLLQSLDADTAAEVGDGLAERLEAVIFTGFEQGLDADALAAAVQASAQDSQPRQSPHPEAVEGRGDAPPQTAAEPPASFDGLRMRADEGEGATASRWWTLGGCDHPPQSLALAHPDPALVVAMLTPQAAEAAA